MQGWIENGYLKMFSEWLKSYFNYNTSIKWNILIHIFDTYVSHSFQTKFFRIYKDVTLCSVLNSCS